VHRFLSAVCTSLPLTHMVFTSPLPMDRSIVAVPSNSLILLIGFTHDVARMFNLPLVRHTDHQLPAHHFSCNIDDRISAAWWSLLLPMKIFSVPTYLYEGISQT